jgi:hypothetical protein
MKFVRVFIAFAAAAVAGFASRADAQTLMRAGIAPAAQQQPERRAPIGIVTINPFLIIIGGFAGDVELSIANGFTGALGGTWIRDEDDTDYSSLDATARYYPGERQPRGFSVGLSVGHVSSEDIDPLATDPDITKGPTLGFFGGYNWLLGRSQRLAIATGIGLKRVFADKDKYPNANEVAPSGRLNIGISF